MGCAVKLALVCLSLLVSSSNGFSVELDLSQISGVSVVTTSGIRQQASKGASKVNLSIDFSDYIEGSLEEWLHAKGFRFEKGAKDRELLELSIHEGSLVLEAKGHIRGFLVNEAVNLEKFSKVRITWGILRYPESASYERQVNNEALMLYIFFGHDKLPSGHLTIPDLPYFIGLFLGKEEKINFPYKGKYFHEGGRFVSVGNPKPYETVISEFDLISAFQTYFEKADVPTISGISLGVDTSSSGEGKAMAYIQRIEFLD